MSDDKHYQKLEENFKSRRVNLQSLLESSVEEDVDEHLFPALESIHSVQERYSQKKFVAEGGEKRIESAFDSIAQRTIAFAIPKDSKKSAHERFLREARLMAFLEHPNIMPVYDIGLADEAPYFTMELVEGDDLAKNRADKKLTRTELDEFLTVFAKVCDAVAFAHSKGVAHLDIKPQNIQLGSFGEVLLCDWGLSKTVDSKEIEELPEELDNSLTADLTVCGVLRGTPGYMSPSLTEGKPGAFADDIYALGATLYYILCGQCPHYSKDVKEMIARTVIEEPPAPSQLFPDHEIPAALEAVALKAMSKTEPYKDALELRTEITRHLRGYATDAEGASLLTLLKLLYKRQKVLCNTVLSSLIVIVCLTAFFIQSLSDEKEKESQARAEAEKAKTEAENSLHKYKNELRYNRYLMEGIDQSLKKIISEVRKKNLPVDIEQILVKVGRGNINGEAYEAAAQMLETLAANSTGEVRNDAIHDLIFTKIFMHDFSGALILLNELQGEERERADISQFIPLCEKFQNKEKPNGLLKISDLREFALLVDKHERARDWFFGHFFSYYSRKCVQDEDILALYNVILDMKQPNREYQIQLTNNYGKKTLFFINPEEVSDIIMPQVLDNLNLDVIDLRGTSLTTLTFARQISVKEINICGTAIENLRPLSYVQGFETVIVDDLKKVKWHKQLTKLGIQVKVVQK